MFFLAESGALEVGVACERRLVFLSRKRRVVVVLRRYEIFLDTYLD